MPSLRDTQKQIADAVLGGDIADDLIRADWLPAQQRMAIYRNHYRITLRDALAANFATVTRLVGEGFFHSMADAFTATHPPSHPCLAEYGADFPMFIADFPAARGLPYLADIASFDWMMTSAAHIPNYQGQAIYSRFPIGQIWAANQPDHESDAVISLDTGGGWFTVEKKDGYIRWHMLDLPEDIFDTHQEQTYVENR